MNFPFLGVLFQAGVLTFLNFRPVFFILVSAFYSTKCTCVLPHYTVIYEDVIFTSLRRLLFYTIYHDKAHNNNGMRHETVRVDRMIDSTFHQNGSDGKRSSSSSYGRKVWHQSHFPHPFCFFSLLLFFFLFYFVTARVITMR